MPRSPHPPSCPIPPVAVAQLKRRPSPPSRGRANAARIDSVALRAAYEAGASTVDLSRAHGVSRKTIRRLLRRAGAALRDVAEASKVRDRYAYRFLEPPVPVAGLPNVEDVFGVVYEVMRATPTPAGWDILRGCPADRRGKRSGEYGIIVTAELARHLFDFRLEPRLHGLPLSDATILRLRRRLGLDWRADNRAWWAAHRSELASMCIDDFAAEFGVHIAAAYHVRRKQQTPG